jgi:hypothetical protein
MAKQVPNSQVFGRNSRKNTGAAAGGNAGKGGNAGNGGNAGKNGKGGNAGGDKNTPVVGPYSRDYFTERQIRANAEREANLGLVPVERIREDYAREAAGADVLGQSFNDMLAKQAAQNAATLQSFNTATQGGVGSGIVQAAGAGAVQQQAAVPMIASGEVSRLKGDVRARETETVKKRREDFRTALLDSERKQREAEREKQAVRIETAASEAALGYKYKEAERDQANKDRSAAQAQQRIDFQIQKYDTGSVEDAVKGASDVLKMLSKQTGKGGWKGEIRFTDPLDPTKTAKIPVDNPVDYNPRNKTPKQNEEFWRKYLKSRGVTVTGPIDRGGLARGTAGAQGVASDFLNSYVQQGYSRQEAYNILSKTPWFGANAAAAARALQEA